MNNTLNKREFLAQLEERGVSILTYLSKQNGKNHGTRTAASAYYACHRARHVWVEIWNKTKR